MSLAVELYGVRIGHLDGTDPRSFDFIATEEGIAEFGVNSRVLSAAIPLTRTPQKSHARRRRNFFTELLPEGDQLDFMLTAAGLRRGDPVGFLARYGRDVAGALQIWDPADPREPPTPSATPVDDQTIRAMLVERQRYPLGNVGTLGRTSLAGVQPKIVLARVDNAWCRVEGGYPSTHIVKPQLEQYPSVIFDEEYGARILRRLGLASYSTEITEFAGLPTLVIERFDRDERIPGGRLHQEDFSQALGAGGVQKYQSHGGVVTLQRMATTLRTVGAQDDLAALARLVVLAAALGNLDMHAKNVGLLHHPDGSVRLAPGYDFVPQSHLPGIDQELAMAVDKRYAFREVTGAHLIRELTSWRMSRVTELVADTLTEVAQAVEDEIPHSSAWPHLQQDILEHTRRLRATSKE